MPGLSPSGDALEMVEDHLGDLLHGLDFGAPHIGAPALEHGGYNIDLLAVKDVAQLLAVEPGAGGALGGGLRDESIEVRALAFRETLAILEQRPAQAFEAGIGLLLAAAGLVHGLGGMGHDMEFVEGYAGVGQMFRHAFDEGLGHIDADAGDLLRRALVFAQELAEPADGLGVAAFGDEHHFVRFGIGGKGQVVVAAPAGGLIDGQHGELGQVRLGQRQFHIALADGLNPVPALANQAGDGGERHLAAHGQDQRLEQQA